MTRKPEVKLVGLVVCVNLSMPGTPFPQITSSCSSLIKSFHENWKAEDRAHFFLV